MKILYQDKDICIIEKSPGQVCEDCAGGIPQLLREQLQVDYIGVVHRLDAGTGGAMVYALNKRSAANLSAQLQNGELTKQYTAVIHGCPPEPKGQLRDLLFHDRRTNKTYCVNRERKGVKEAVLEYEVIKTENGCSLLKIKLLTGRTHQIRVQLGSRKMPLLGDKRYGAKDEYKNFALWAQTLTFIHPANGKTVTFQIPPPQTVPWTEFILMNDE